MYVKKIERNVMGMRKNVNRNSRLDSTDTNVDDDDDDLGSVNLNVEGKMTNLIHFTLYFIACAQCLRPPSHGKLLSALLNYNETIFHLLLSFTLQEHASEHLLEERVQFIPDPPLYFVVCISLYNAKNNFHPIYFFFFISCLYINIFSTQP